MLKSPGDISCVHTHSLTEVVTAEIHFPENISLMVSVVPSATWVLSTFAFTISDGVPIISVHLLSTLDTR